MTAVWEYFITDGPSKHDIEIALFDPECSHCKTNRVVRFVLSREDTSGRETTTVVGEVEKAHRLDPNGVLWSLSGEGTEGYRRVSFSARTFNTHTRKGIMDVTLLR